MPRPDLCRLGQREITDPARIRPVRDPSDALAPTPRRSRTRFTRPGCRPHQDQQTRARLTRAECSTADGPGGPRNPGPAAGGGVLGPVHPPDPAVHTRPRAQRGRGAGDDDDADGVLDIAALQGRAELGDHRRGEGVLLSGAIQGEDGDARGDIDEQFRTHALDRRRPRPARWALGEVLTGAGSCGRWRTCAPRSARRRAGTRAYRGRSSPPRSRR